MTSSEPPVFIIGSPRSGTTVLTWCLGQHPNILPVEETNWFAPLALTLQSCFEIGTARGERSQLSAMCISREELFRSIGTSVNDLIRRHRRIYEDVSKKLANNGDTELSNLYRLSRNDSDPKQRWVDGTPEYSFSVYPLRKLFPGAKFIHIVRDLKSVVSSLMHFSNVAGFQIVKTESEAYEYWLRTVNASIAAERAFGKDVVLRIRYSDLVQDPESTLRLCLNFLGESFHDDCLLPLKKKINSSKVPRSYEPSQVKAGVPTLRQALELDEELARSRTTIFPGDLKLVDELEAKFLDQVRYTAWAGRELNRRIKLERRTAADKRGSL